MPQITTRTIAQAQLNHYLSSVCLPVATNSGSSHNTTVEVPMAANLRFGRFENCATNPLTVQAAGHYGHVGGFPTGIRDNGMRAPPAARQVSCESRIVSNGATGGFGPLRSRRWSSRRRKPLAYRQVTVGGTAIRGKPLRGRDGSPARMRYE